jgi:caffeoyl-CoA O-methyltransferase
MKNYPFDPMQLLSFSETNPYGSCDKLLNDLNQLKEKYHFPALLDDIGSFLAMMTTALKTQTVFEFGSGYGHSAYWFLKNPHLKKIYLTEKRDDLQGEFHNLSFPRKEIMHYHQGDAFEFVEKVEGFDFVLVDGVKADYKRFIELITPKLASGAMIAVDNSYWRGSFLDEEFLSKKSAKNIKELHEFIKESKDFKSCFLPFRDGLSLLLKI